MKGYCYTRETFLGDIREISICFYTQILTSMKETKTLCSYERNRRNVEKYEKNIENTTVDDFVHLP